MANKVSQSPWSGALLRAASLEGWKKMDPRVQVRNPVMAVVWLGAVVLTVLLPFHFSGFNLQIALWLWLTLWFANFAEAVAEGRGKAQAASLRKAKTTLQARRLKEDGSEEAVSAADLAKGDRFVCEAGDPIPADGEIIEGIATVDESAITGESAPVIRESGGDRSAVTGGTRVLSDRIVVRVTVEQGQSFLDKMIGLIETAKRQRTPNEAALGILLVSLTVIFVLVVFSLPLMLKYPAFEGVQITLPILVALLVCLIPTTIGALLSAIGISGMDRLVRHNVLAMSGRAVEAAGDVDVLLLDKTGTITLGNRQATEFVPAPSVEPQAMADAAQLASLADETPEGRSVMVLAKNKFGLRGRDLHALDATPVKFTAETRMSGLDIHSRGGVRKLRKGAVEAMERFAQRSGITLPAEVKAAAERIARDGGTPLLVADETKVYGVIHLKDVVKGGIRERFEHLRRMGIRTIMVTGDNPATAAAIAAEAGVDDFIAEAKPEDKLGRIQQEQGKGHLVAMMGDGTNDAPALAQADVGVAMNSGTQAAREAGNMVDLDSNPTKLIEVVEIGKQLLMTRGSLTTFSLTNDIAKYFAILPAIFIGLFASHGAEGPLAALNIMGLHSPQSAILSAVIFNALVIVALIPLALKGVPYKPIGAAEALRRNLLVYGLGGLIVPFAGIKLIDLIVAGLGLA
ncbi:potassium-transporting ATPase subunit KdpB [Ruficoccus amylovorans]|uniref:Potassium-transporting ATPase ATP-binding subunit n=1 Tax=Ruficoccus amylovorans TaxID=1804625 RepID=A0A842HFM8_9BACT|nr:potassium-transporting ATPase subunit KdpB [Ruficoccus amylovorans]MBC2595455.1 potassium-transporting ATPase subunit KdpB [Ruficoccus amylovorans]